MYFWTECGFAPDINLGCDSKFVNVGITPQPDCQHLCIAHLTCVNATEIANGTEIANPAEISNIPHKVVI